jgi:hypothetical protein
MLTYAAGAACAERAIQAVGRQQHAAGVCVYMYTYTDRHTDRQTHTHRHTHRHRHTHTHTHTHTERHTDTQTQTHTLYIYIHTHTLKQHAAAPHAGEAVLLPLPPVALRVPGGAHFKRRLRLLQGTSTFLYFLFFLSVA